MRIKLCSLLILGLSLVAMSGAGAAGNKTATEKPMHVELFKAMKDGLVDVKLIQKNSLEATVSVTNKGKAPLQVDMPGAFAGVPILAQPPGPGMFGDGGGMFGMGGDMGGMGGGRRGGMGGGRSGGGNQSTGGGMGGGGGGMGGGGMGGGGGWFIPPEKTVREKVRTVCLEHGKKEPRPGVEYAMVPLGAHTQNKTTQVLCAMLADETVDQKALQAAVWNQENGMTFPQLAAKRNVDLQTHRPIPYFTNSELDMGQRLIANASDRVKQMEEKAKNNAQTVESDRQASGVYQTDDAAADSRTGDKVEKLTEKLLSK